MSALVWVSQLLLTGIREENPETLFEDRLGGRDRTCDLGLSNINELKELAIVAKMSPETKHSFLHYHNKYIPQLGSAKGTCIH